VLARWSTLSSRVAVVRQVLALAVDRAQAAEPVVSARELALVLLLERITLSPLAQAVMAAVERVQTVPLAMIQYLAPSLPRAVDMAV